MSTIGRLQYEVGADTKRLNEDLQKMVDSVKSAFGKVSTAQTNYLAKFQEALNPTAALTRELKLLEKAGVGADDIIKVLGADIKRAGDIATQNNQKMSQEFQAAFAKVKTSGSDALQHVGKVIEEFAHQPVSTAVSGLTSMVAALGPTALGYTALAAGVVATTTALMKLGEHLSEEVVHLRNHAMVSGETIQDYQAINRAGLELGVSTESLARMIGMLNRQLATGDKMDFVKVLNAMRLAAGESAADISHGLVPILDDLGKRLAELPEGFEKGRLVNAAFNRRLQEIGSIVLLTKGHLGEYIEDLKKHNVYSEEAVSGMIEMHNAFSGLGRIWDSLKLNLSDYIRMIIMSWPYMKALAEWAQKGGIPAPPPPMSPEKIKELKESSKELVEWLKQSGGPFAGIAGALATITQEVPSTAPSSDDLRRQKEGLELAKLMHDGMLHDRELLEQIKRATEEYFQAIAVGDESGAAFWSRHYEMFQQFEQELPGIINRIADLEAEYESKYKSGDYATAQRLGREVAYWKDIEKGIKEASKDFDKYLTTLQEIDKITEQIAVKGHAALVPGKEQLDAAAKKFTLDQVRAMQDYASIQNAIGRDVTQSKINQLRMEQQITATIIPRTELEREQIAVEKTFLDFAIREEEIRLKYAQKREEIINRIRTLESIPLWGPAYAEAARKDLEIIDQQMEDELRQTILLRSAEITRIHATEYKKMIDIYKQYAGNLFDAIFNSGKKGFEALLDWLKNSFFRLFGSLFENAMAGILERTGIYDVFRGLLAGSYPGGRGGSVSYAGLTKAVQDGTTQAIRSTAVQNMTWEPNVGWVPEVGISPAGVLGGTAAKGGGAGLLGGSFGAMLPGLLGGATLAGIGAVGNPYGKAAIGLGGGLLTAGALVAMMPSLITVMAPMFSIPVIGAVAAALFGGIALAKAITGKNAYQAGAMETARDFGVGLSSGQFEQFLTSKSISESQAYPIRKDISSSPAMLTQLGQLAKQQGTYQQFLASLERVTTAWGTFNFRAAYEIGDLTGDWSQLDKVFVDAFKSSAALEKNLPNWREVLLITGDAAKKVAQQFEVLWTTFQETGQMTQEFVDYLNQSSASLDESARSSTAFAEQLEKARLAAAKFTEIKGLIEGFQSLKDSLPTAAAQTKTIYQAFLETGNITRELSDQIREFGGDLQAFSELGGLIKINNRFQELVSHFASTGEILSDLRKIVLDFGGDLGVLDQAGELPGLMKGLDSIKSLASGLAALQQTAIQKILAGEWSADIANQLQAMGIDPSRIQDLAGLIRGEKSWDQAISTFQTGMKYVWSADQQKYVQARVGLEKGGVLEQALLKYGGPEGAAAVAAYGAGFNKITPELLAKVKAAMDVAYADKIKETLTYLGTIQKDVSSKITNLTKSIQEQLDLVGNNISKAMDAAKEAVVTELDAILAAINKLVANATGETTVPGSTSTGGNDRHVPGAASGGLVRVHDYEAILDRQQTQNLLRQEVEPAVNIYIDQRNSTFASEIEFQRSVEKALSALRARGYKIALAR